MEVSDDRQAYVSDDRHQIFAAVYAETLSIETAAEAACVTYETGKDWCSRKKRPKIRAVIDTALLKRIDTMRDQLQAQSVEKWCKVLDGFWSVHRKALLNDDLRNAIRALEQLGKIYGLYIIRTELTGPGGGPVQVESPKRFDPRKLPFEKREALHELLREAAVDSKSGPVDSQPSEPGKPG